MPKRRPVSISDKRARDKAVNAAIRIAMAQSKSQPDGPILVRRERLAGKRMTNSLGVAESRSEEAVQQPTAIQLAMSKAGLLPKISPTEKHVPAESKRITEPSSVTQNTGSLPDFEHTKGKPQKKSKKNEKSKVRIIKRRVKRKKLPEFDPASDIEARAERMIARFEEAAKIFEKIEYLPPDKLTELWSKNVTRMTDTKSAFQALAKEYVLAIEAEWRRRNALARLDPDHFEWPSTKAAPGTGSFGSMEHAEGILGYLGYHVGKTGESSPVRRQSLLSRVFEGSLPPINGPEYMEEWGKPDTPSRLRKMAESIASAVKSAKRRSHADYSVAIDHWEQDLQFLYDRYYVGRFKFHWPGR